MKTPDEWLNLLENPLDGLSAEGISAEEQAEIVRQLESLGFDPATLRFEFQDGELGIAINRYGDDAR